MLRLIAIFLSTLLLTGCAHRISINPPLAEIVRPTSAQPIDKTAALYLTDDMRASTVTVPSGGGDSVTYQPYRDLEPGLMKMLKNAFTKSTRVIGQPDYDQLRKNGVQYLVTPSVTGVSSTSRFGLWAPVQFQVTLKCTILDVVSGLTTSKEVVGEGNYDPATELNGAIPADYGSHAARRASVKAILKMQDALVEAPEFRQSSRN